MENYPKNKFNKENLKSEKIKPFEEQKDLSQELSKEILTAQETIKKEFNILPSEDRESIEHKVEETIKSPSFLERLRNVPLLRNALKTLIVVFSLLKAEPIFSQTKPEIVTEKNKIEYIQQENKTFEANRRLLGKNEYVVPEKVMIAFGEAVDPGMIGIPAAGYFEKDYLNNEKKRDIFRQKMKKLGYSEEETKVFESYFRSGNIVFNESDLQKENFRDILAHERLHREISHLPAEDKAILNEARDFILKDFTKKEQQWSKEIDSLFILLQEGKINYESYDQKSKEAIMKTKPILLDNSGKTNGLIPVLRNPEEFYAYLMMNKLHPSVAEYINFHFPKSFQIFENLKNKIYQEIQEKEKK